MIIRKRMQMRCLVTSVRVVLPLYSDESSDHNCGDKLISISAMTVTLLDSLGHPASVAIANSVNKI